MTEKIIIGISDIRDESNKEGVRIVVEVKRDAFPKKILNQLYQLTQLQTSFSYNMIALTDRGSQPKLFNLVDMLEEFITHRKEVITRRTQYDLKIAEARLHILEGLKIALDAIDEVIATIKASKSKDDAQSQLMSRFGLSERQSQAILEMQLQRLSGLERQKIEDERLEKIALVTDLKDILSSPKRIIDITSSELSEIRGKYADARRTDVQRGAVGEWNPRDTIPDEEVVVTLSKNGYVKRIKASAFRAQRRGGVGVSSGLKEEDEVGLLLATTNHRDLLWFTNTGRAFRLPVYEIPEASRTAKGLPVVNLISLQKDEAITALIDAADAENAKNLTLISRQAIVKRVDLEDISNIRASGLIVMKPKDGDELGWVRVTTGANKVLLVSGGGKAIQFDEEDVRVMGRGAAGVRGMRLAEGDALVDAVVVNEGGKYLLTVTETGMGKISSLEDYREQGRGGSGVKVGAVTEKTGAVIAVSVLDEHTKAF